MSIHKGFITDWLDNTILPITRGELVLDKDGQIALHSKYFLAGENGSEYGLISKAERELLNVGTEGTGGISDLHTKLNYINTGLYFNDTLVKFYTDAGATPINITSTGPGSINIIPGQNNTVDFSLKALTSDGSAVATIVKNIQVDKFGRVTAVSGSALESDDLPTLIYGKNISSSILNSCETSVTDIPDKTNAIVNKSYVDGKFKEVINKATGALKFGGVISDYDSLETLLQDVTAWDNYFKITGTFTIPGSDLNDTKGLKLDQDKNLPTAIGDTVIIYQPVANSTRAKLIYIPSGDDITTITVLCDGDTSPALNMTMGDVTLQFARPFNARNSGRTAYITLPEVSTSEKGGYLSRDDYNAFKSLAGDLAVSYSGEFSSGAGVYKIGTLTIGNSEEIIYGKYNISNLSLENGTTNTYNPVLKFTETGATDVNITLQGIGGIAVNKNGNTVEFRAANELLPGADKYLTLDAGYKFGVKIGSIDDQAINDGLTDYAEFANLRLNVLTKTTKYLLLEESLRDTTQEYHYGSTKLVEAITLTI